MTDYIDALDLRRMKFAATKQAAASTVPDLMARIEEAQVRARIQQARNEAGLSQPEFADLLNVGKRTVQNYEAQDGENAKVPYDRLGDISDITGKSLKWLLHGDDDEVTQFASRLERFEESLATVAKKQAALERQQAKLLKQQGMLTETEREMLAEVSAVLNRLGRDVGRGQPLQRSGRRTLREANEPAA